MDHLKPRLEIVDREDYEELPLLGEPLKTVEIRKKMGTVEKKNLMECPRSRTSLLGHFSTCLELAQRLRATNLTSTLQSNPYIRRNGHVAPRKPISWQRKLTVYFRQSPSESQIPKVAR